MGPPSPKQLVPLTQPIALDPDHIASKPISLVITETVSGYDFTITDRSTSQTLYTVKGRSDSQHFYKDVYDAKDVHIFSLVKENKAMPKHYALLKPDGTEWLPVDFKWGSESSLPIVYALNCPRPCRRDIGLTYPDHAANARQISTFPNHYTPQTNPTNTPADPPTTTTSSSSPTATLPTATLSITASYFSRNADYISIPPSTPSSIDPSSKTDTKGEVAAHVFRDFYTMNEFVRAKRTYYLDVAPGMDISVAVGSTLYLNERVNEGADKKNSGGSSAGWIGAVGGAAGGAAA